MQTAIEMKNVAEPFILGRAIRHLEAGPRRHFRRRHRQSIFFHRHDRRFARQRDSRRRHLESDESGRHLRSRSEERIPTAKRYERITYTEALTKRLQVMDSTAFSLCMDNRIPIIVFDMNKPSNIRDIVLGQESRHAGFRVNAIAIATADRNSTIP